MNCRERVLITLDHSEPDKVPYYEHVIQQPKLASLLGIGVLGSGGELNLDLKKVVSFIGNIKRMPKFLNKHLFRIANSPKIISPIAKLFVKEFFKLFIKIKVDLSVFMFGPFSSFKFLRPNFLVSGFGQVFELKSVAGIASIYYVGGYFRNKEDYYNFPKMNSEEPLGTMLFKKIQKSISDNQIYIIPGFFTGLFDSTSMGFGIETFSKLLIKDQPFIKKVIREKEKFYTELIKHAIDEFNLEAFFIGDDLAFNSGPFISPRYFNKIFLPSYQRISNMMHKRGVKLIFHTDGDIRPILDSLLKFCDSIHPWQESANIDIFQMKKDYGDKICIKGNVPISMLVYKTQKEISEYVKKLIKICAPGGGYMMSSGNSIIPNIPWQNYLTMLSTFWKYRDYPIKVP